MGDAPGVKRKASEMENTKPEPKNTSKVGESDEAVVLDQPYLRNLGKAMETFLKGKNRNDPMFEFNPAEGVRLWNFMVREHGYTSAGINCTYQIRHGSCSTDVLTGLRTLTDVQRRGRWQTAKSVRRYANGGRLSQVYDSLSPAQKAEAHSAEEWMHKILGQQPKP